MASEAGTLPSSQLVPGELISENRIPLYSPSLHSTRFWTAYSLGYNLSSYLNWIKQVISDTASH